MKRVLLIIAGIVIAAGFTFYILEIDPFDKSAAVSEDTAAQAAMVAADTTAAPIVTTAAPEITAAPTLDLSPVQTKMPTPTPEPLLDGRWELVWRDTFDGPCVDLESWTEVDRRDNYNGELQYYTPRNSYIGDGCLYLTAREEEKDGKSYTSGMVNTEYKKTFLYGRVEARIRLPHGKGLFPAFWLLSENYEIDIMEMIGSEPSIVYGVNHCCKNGRITKTYGKIENVDTSQFHVYALEWERDELRWYFDDTLFYSTTKKVSDEPMYILFTMAVGGVWPGRPNADTLFPCSMVVDEIALYRDTLAQGGESYDTD